MSCRLVTDAMAYQICKDIGAMFVVLDGRANAIVLTGGIAHGARFTALIKKRVDTLAPVLTYAGENEMQALAEGGLRALRDPKQAAHLPLRGASIWKLSNCPRNSGRFAIRLWMAETQTLDTLDTFFAKYPRKAAAVEVGNK